MLSRFPFGQATCWLVLCVALAGFFAAAPLRAESRPNIVLLISDDHDNEHLGFMGHPAGHTPTLDALARGGCVFTHAHLPMSRCHPTLASFLSGRWPHQTGIYYNFGDKTLDPTDSLPGLLKQAGYATYVEGKYWEGDPRAMGFTHGKGKTAQKFVRQDQDELFAFIDNVGGTQPLFIWWAPMLPHTPHNPPRKYLEQFDRQRIAVPDWTAGDQDLYDLQADPAEQHDLSGQPEHAERLVQLRAAVLQWWRDTGGRPLAN